jgi:hypothetical protein
MRQYPGDERRIFDPGQHHESSLASGAAVNLNAEHPLQALRPSDGERAPARRFLPGRSDGSLRKLGFSRRA